MEIYKCKKCGKEFPKEELKKYRAHTIACKGVVETPKVEEVIKEDKKVKPYEEPYKTTKAKEVNSCRGYYENNKDKICKMYSSCEECWKDFV